MFNKEFRNLLVILSKVERNDIGYYSAYIQVSYYMTKNEYTLSKRRISNICKYSRKDRKSFFLREFNPLKMTLKQVTDYLDKPTIATFLNKKDTILDGKLNNVLLDVNTLVYDRLSTLNVSELCYEL